MDNSNNANGNGLPLSLDLNLSLGSNDPQQVPALSLINRRHALGLPAGHLDHQTSRPAMTWRLPQQQQLIQDDQNFIAERNFLAMGGAIPFHHFSPLMELLHPFPNHNYNQPRPIIRLGYSTNNIYSNAQIQELQSYFDWQQAVHENYNNLQASRLTMGGYLTPPLDIINNSSPPSWPFIQGNNNITAAAAATTMGYLTPLDIINGGQSMPINQNRTTAATRPSSSRRNSSRNVPIYQPRSISTRRRARRNQALQAIQNLIHTHELVFEPTAQPVPAAAAMAIEVDHDDGLDEGQIMMSVERLVHCPSFVMSEHIGEACPICQDVFNEEGDDICKLRCNHIFHFECIKGWLMEKNLCPVCRAPAMYF